MILTSNFSVASQQLREALTQLKGARPGHRETGPVHSGLGLEQRREREFRGTLSLSLSL